MLLLFDQIIFTIVGKYVLLFTYLFPLYHVESDKTKDVYRSQIVRVESHLQIL